MHHVLYTKVLHLEGGNVRIEIILGDEVRLLWESKRGGGLERRSLGYENRGVEVLSGNRRGYSLTRGGKYTAAIRAATSLTGTGIHRALSQVERTVRRARGGT